MNKIHKKEYSEEEKAKILLEKNSFKKELEAVFEKHKGIKIFIPRQGHIQLNVQDFDYWHPEESFVLDYKVKL